MYKCFACACISASQTCHIGAGNRMHVLSKNSKWSYSLSHLLALLFISLLKLFEDAIHEYTGFANFYVIPVSFVFLNHTFENS